MEITIGMKGEVTTLGEREDTMLRLVWLHLWRAQPAKQLHPLFPRKRLL